MLRDKRGEKSAGEPYSKQQSYSLIILNTLSIRVIHSSAILKAACHLSCTGRPRVECGINGKLMQRLEKEARAERERRI